MLTATDLVPALVHHLEVGADVLLVRLRGDARRDDAPPARVDVEQLVVARRDLRLPLLKIMLQCVHNVRVYSTKHVLTYDVC